MNLKTFICGDYRNNCYVLNKEDSKEAVVIDPGAPNKDLEKYLAENKLDVKYIFLTHGHGDHTDGIPRLKEMFPEVKLVAGKNEAKLLADSRCGYGVGDLTSDIEAVDGDSYDFCGMHFDILETPGHTPGGISIYMKNEKIVFSGDTLFFASIGRTDFYGGNYAAIIKSITEKLFSLPNDTRVLPGHDRETSIEFERNCNPFVN